MNRKPGPTPRTNLPPPAADSNFRLLKHNLSMFLDDCNTYRVTLEQLAHQNNHSLALRQFHIYMTFILIITSFTNFYDGLESEQIVISEATASHHSDVVLSLHNNLFWSGDEEDDEGITVFQTILNGVATNGHYP
jgi:hypothetical protein